MLNRFKRPEFNVKVASKFYVLIEKEQTLRRGWGLFPQAILNKLITSTIADIKL